eukprot:1429322-Amphidinium_carterae.1
MSSNFTWGCFSCFRSVPPFSWGAELPSSVSAPTGSTDQFVCCCVHVLMAGSMGSNPPTSMPLATLPPMGSRPQ